MIIFKSLCSKRQKGNSKNFLYISIFFFFFYPGLCAMKRNFKSVWMKGQESQWVSERACGLLGCKGQSPRAARAKEHAAGLRAALLLLLNPKQHWSFLKSMLTWSWISSSTTEARSSFPPSWPSLFFRRMSCRAAWENRWQWPVNFSQRSPGCPWLCDLGHRSGSLSLGISLSYVPCKEAENPL